MRNSLFDEKEIKLNLKIIDEECLKLVSLSVVIPCFNCEKTLIRSINSILLQEQFLPKEIILVNDCSSDNTQSVIESIKHEYPTIIKNILLQKNVGAASARNIGLNLATSKYVALLDADDTWHHKKLLMQYTFMLNNPEVILSGHLCAIMNEIKDNVVINNNFLVKKISKFDALIKTPFNTPTVIFQNLGFIRFPENRRYAEDANLWQNIIYSNHKVVRIECLLAFVHKPLYGANGLSSNMWQMEKGELDNFLILFHNKKIKWYELYFAVSLSIAKFIRRVVILKVKKDKK